MKTLQQLIKELCPNGVVYKKLGEICGKISNKHWEHETEELKYIDLSSVDMNTHTILELSTITKDTAPSRAKQIINTNDIIFATTRPTQLRSCIIPDKLNNHICSTGYCVLRTTSPNVLHKWVYYSINTPTFSKYVEQNQTQGGSYPAISDKLVKDFEIPVPPFPVQEKIVEILDTFTALTAKLQAELQAELQARQQQYEYYRNHLLSFGGYDNIQDNDDTPVATGVQNCHRGGGTSTTE